MNTITLYHGSSYDFYIIDLTLSKPYKDFGQGFYTSADISHAKSMAERNYYPAVWGKSAAIPLSTN